MVGDVGIDYCYDYVGVGGFVLGWVYVDGCVVGVEVLLFG